MNNDLETLPEREEIELLLPWYAIGKLSIAETQRVAAYLARHPDLERHVTMILAERDQTVLANEAIAAPSAQALDRLLAVAKPSAARTLWRGIMANIEDFFTSPSAPAVRWAAVAAALLIVVQSAAIGTLITGSQAPGYETASGTSTALDGSFVIVRFADDATAKTMTETLSKLDMTIVEGPKPGGLFKVRIGSKGLDETLKSEKIQQLRQQSDLIVIVMPAT